MIYSIMCMIEFIMAIILVIYAYSSKPMANDRIGLYITSVINAGLSIAQLVADSFVIYGLICRKYPLMVKKGKQHENRPRLNNMNGARSIRNQERRSGNNGGLPNLFRPGENYEESPQLSQESNGPIVGRGYLWGELANGNGEQ